MRSGFLVSSPVSLIEHLGVIKIEEVELVISDSLSSGESALVFTSGGAISVIIQHLLDMDDEALITWNRTLINTSVTRILVNAGKLRLVSVNEHLHLPSDQVTYR